MTITTTHAAAEAAVNPDTVRAHVKALIAARMPLTAVCADVRIVPDTLYHFMAGRQRISDDVARAILEVTPRRCFPAGYVDVTGSRRRMQALAANGHGWIKIGKALGVRPGTAMDIARDERRESLRDTLAEKITRLYEEWAGLTGTPRVAQQAAERGWLGPKHWHRVDIDDPHAQPCTPEVDPDDLEYGPLELWEPPAYEQANVLHAVAGVMFRDELTTAELVETVRRLAERGMSDSDIHIHLRWTPDYAHRSRPSLSSPVANFRRNHGVPPPPEGFRETREEKRRQVERYCVPAGLVYRRYEDRPSAVATDEERAAHEAAVIARASVA